jgi:hypothetical protein
MLQPGYARQDRYKKQCSEGCRIEAQGLVKVVFALAYEGQIEATSDARNERAYPFTGPLRLLKSSTLGSIFEIRCSRWKKYEMTWRSAMCMGRDGGR